MHPDQSSHSTSCSQRKKYGVSSFIVQLCKIQDLTPCVLQEAGAGMAQLTRRVAAVPARATVAESVTAPAVQPAGNSATGSVSAPTIEPRGASAMDHIDNGDNDSSYSDDDSYGSYPGSNAGTDDEADRQDQTNQNKEIITQQNALIASLRAQLSGAQQNTADGSTRENAPCCPICMEPRKRTMMATPCMHSGYCQNCTKDIAECPICREQVKFVEVFDVSYY